MHPVSTTVKNDVNKQMDEYCRTHDCSKYKFIRDAIEEKLNLESRPEEIGNPPAGNEQPTERPPEVEKRTFTVDGVEYEF